MLVLPDLLSIIFVSMNSLEDDGTYINDINGLDASEREDVGGDAHDFKSEILSN